MSNISKQSEKKHRRTKRIFGVLLLLLKIKKYLFNSIERREPSYSNGGVIKHQIASRTGRILFPFDRSQTNLCRFECRSGVFHLEKNTHEFRGTVGGGGRKTVYPRYPNSVAERGQRYLCIVLSNIYRFSISIT